MSTTTQERPGWGPEAAHKSFGCDALSLPENGVNLPRLAALSELLGSFARRVLEDALTEALPAYWERRADQFAAALPDPTVKPEKFAELTEIVAALHERAEFCRRYPDPALAAVAALAVDELGGAR